MGRAEGKRGSAFARIERALPSAQRPVASLVVEGTNEGSETYTDRSVAIDINLDLFDEPLTGQILVADRPAGLAEVVPVARSLSDEIVRRIIDRNKRTGLNIACKKGCAACCRYLVPLSVPEALCMWNELQTVPPTQQQQVITAFMDASQQILHAGPPPVSQDRVAPEENLTDALNDISYWYAGIGIACPFLEREACTAYSFRPVACREYMVTSPAEYCLPAKTDQVQRPKPPFSIAEALGILAAEMEEAEVESVILPLVPAWRQNNHHRARRTWPAPALFECFVAIIHDLAARRRLAAAKAA